MAWRISADVERFDEAIESFSQRILLSDGERKRIPLNARNRAFWIAGVAQLDVVQDVRDHLRRAIERGETLEQFRQTVREKLAAAWQGDNPAHIETVFRNAVQSSYNAGRWRQMTEPSVARFRPYFMYDAILDGRTTELCQELNGTILPNEDPFWDTHWPPLHHRCRSSVRNLRRSEAERRGVTPQAPDVPPQEGFGLSPDKATIWKPPARSRDRGLLRELGRKERALASRPPPPPLPKILSANPKARRIPPPPPLQETFSAPGGFRAVLTPKQQLAQQTSRHLNRSYGARQAATYSERRTWFLWQWVTSSTRWAPVLVKQAAIREFGLRGIAWTKKPHTFSPGDVARMRRDLRRLYEQTQKDFERRGIKTVTLYRGTRGPTPRPGAVESWTEDREMAERFAGLRDWRTGELKPNPPKGAEVQRMEVPVESILAHHRGPGWTDGPFGDQAEYLVLY